MTTICAGTTKHPCGRILARTPDKAPGAVSHGICAGCLIETEPGWPQFFRDVERFYFGGLSSDAAIMAASHWLTTEAK